jgi:hypothetical protein
VLTYIACSTVRARIDRFPLAGSGDCAALQCAAAELLGQFCSIVRPPFALEVPLFAGLLAECASVASQLQGTARTALTVAMCHTIVLPWYDIPDDKQEWASREARWVCSHTVRFV